MEYYIIPKKKSKLQYKILRKRPIRNQPIPMLRSISYDNIIILL